MIKDIFFLTMKKDNNKETLELIDGILLPYIKKNKEGFKPS